MPVPFWAGHYIGLPFQDHGRDRRGIDCWGLVRLVLAEQFGFALPSLSAEYRHTGDASAIGPLIAREIPKFDAVAEGRERLGDIIVLRLRGAPLHVGLVLGDGQMLHAEDGIDSSITRYHGPRWQDRIFGFYRYMPYDPDTSEPG